ncbi:MAG: hypothetical protein GY737_12085 [Desulfobacteraceae bacterium]|nr:hypothetical protein [Desulfobacteraceae bacterium]
MLGSGLLNRCCLQKEHAGPTWEVLKVFILKGKTFMKKFLLAGLLLLMGTGANAAPVDSGLQLFGDNGHYYEFYRNYDSDRTSSISWTDANHFAASKELVKGGVTYKGHLATITSAGENDFIVGNSDHEKTWLGGTKVNNNWTWVTDENWGKYTNWLTSPEQQPSGNGDYMWFWQQEKWDDTSNGDSLATGFIVEYDVSAPVPVPAAFWLLGSGLALLIGCKKR